MHAIAQGGVQAAESARVMIVLVAFALVAFWRMIVRLVIALIAVGLLVTIGAGIVGLMHLMHGGQP
jgi:hypothetical protein